MEYLFGLFDSMNRSLQPMADIASRDNPGIAKLIDWFGNTHLNSLFSKIRVAKGNVISPLQLPLTILAWPIPAGIAHRHIFEQPYPAHATYASHALTHNCNRRYFFDPNNRPITVQSQTGMAKNDSQKPIRGIWESGRNCNLFPVTGLRRSIWLLRYKHRFNREI